MIDHPYKLKKKGRFWHYTINLAGKRKRGSTKAVSKELAHEFAMKIYSDLYRNTHRLSSKIEKVAIKDFIDQHIRQNNNNLSFEWLYIKETILAKFLDYVTEKGTIYLNEIKLEHLEHYKALQLTKNKPKTASNTMQVIGSLLNHAYRLDYIQENPFIRLSKIRGIEKNKKRFLSKDEIKTIIEATKGTYLENFVLTAIYTGLRRRELIYLEHSDIDSEKKLLYVRNKDGFRTKSRKERVMPLHKELWPLFKNKKEGYCFLYRGRLIHEDTATRNFKLMADKAGIRDVSLHILRHTFISHCLMNGISMWEVSKWAGHSSSYITELYGHLCPDRREIDRLTI